MLQPRCNEDMADAFHVRLPFGAKSRCFATGRASAFSVAAPGGSGQCKTTRIMTTLSIQRNTQRTFSLKDWTKAKGASFSLWLSQPSEFYIRICEYPVTRLLAIRVNLVALCLIIGAAAVEQQLLASVIAVLCAAWLVYRINQPKKGGEK